MGRQRGDYIIFFQKNPCKSLIFHVNSIEEITASNDDFYGYYIILLQQPKTAPKERRGPISVGLERGLNASHYASIQPTVIESQI